MARGGLVSVRQLVVGGVLALSSTACGGNEPIAPGGDDKPAQLVFITPPAGAVAGAPFATQPVVEIENAAGDRVSSTALVTLTLSGGVSGSKLIGTTTVAAVDGRAGFADVGVDSIGSGFTLVASASGLSSATSSAFASDAGMVLEFIDQPDSATGGTPFKVQPTVAVRDRSGNPVTLAVPVTVSLSATAAGGALSGTLTVTATNGTAHFSNISVDKAGQGYRLLASAPGAVPASSDSFQVIVGPPSSFSVAALRDTILGLGQSTTVTLTLLDRGLNPIIGQAAGLTLFVKTAFPDSGAWVDLDSFVESSTGVYVGTITATRVSAPKQFHHVDELPLYASKLYVLLNGGGGFGPMDFYVTDSPAGDVAHISAGWRHTCAISTGGTLRCWGDDGYGQSGTGSSSMTPKDVEGGGTWSAVSAGYHHSCGIKTGGTTFCWGNNDYGQLGNNTQDSGDQPVAVSGGLSFTQVVASLGLGTGSALSDQGFTSCGVTAVGAAYCWGDNRAGQGGSGSTGDGISNEAHVPTAIAGSGVYRSIGVGPWHGCAVNSGGSGLCWGTNVGDALGTSAAPSATCNGLPCNPTPITVTGGPFTASSLTVGVTNACALAGTNAYCWGTFGTTSTLPQLVSGGHAFTQVDAGGGFACGVTTANAIYCWGDNTYGQLGDGSMTPSSAPVLVSGGVHFKAVSAGDRHACGITTLGALYCWGDNSAGQLGDGTTTPGSTPVLVDW